MPHRWRPQRRRRRRPRQSSSVPWDAESDPLFPELSLVALVVVRLRSRRCRRYRRRRAGRHRGPDRSRRAHRGTGRDQPGRPEGSRLAIRRAATTTERHEQTANTDHDQQDEGTRETRRASARTAGRAVPVGGHADRGDDVTRSGRRRTRRSPSTPAADAPGVATCPATGVAVGFGEAVGLTECGSVPSWRPSSRSAWASVSASGSASASVSGSGSARRRFRGRLRGRGRGGLGSRVSASASGSASVSGVGVGVATGPTVNDPPGSIARHAGVPSLRPELFVTRKRYVCEPAVDGRRPRVDAAAGRRDIVCQTSCGCVWTPTYTGRRSASAACPEGDRET